MIKLILRNLIATISAPLILFLSQMLADFDWSLWLEPKWAPVATVLVGTAGFYARTMFNDPSRNEFEDAR